MSKLSKALLASVMFHLALLLSVSAMATEWTDASEGMEWKIDASDEDYIRLHMNGNVTHGDALMLFFNKSDCSKAEVILYFSSYEKEIMDYEGSQILMKFGKNELDSKISHVIDYVPPLRIAVIRIGFVEKRILSKWETLGDELEVKISTNNPQKVQDLFDIKFNSYSMPGLTDALKSMERNCLGGVTEAAA